MATYKILSLDGGGPWALLQAMALQKIYKVDTRGHQVLKDFNLVAANGGGSITLAGLIANMPLNAILEDWFMSNNMRRRVFAPTRFLNTWFGRGAKYSTSKKSNTIKAILGDYAERSLSDVHEAVRGETLVAANFLISAYDCGRNRAEFFRSDRDSACASATPLDPQLADAIHASTTAPAPLFDSPAEVGDGRFWDGAAAGLYNPILAALTEAIANRREAKDIRILSIGSGTVQLPIWMNGENPKLTRGVDDFPQDLDELTRSVLYDPPESATFVAHVMLGQPLPAPGVELPLSGNVVRLSPLIRPVQKGGKWVPPEGMDDKKFERLAKLELDAVAPEGVQLIKALGDVWIAGAPINQPIRSGRNLRPEIGHETFAAAKAAWEKIR